jgi:AraC-like DNA-binding protein
MISSLAALQGGVLPDVQEIVQDLQVPSTTESDRPSPPAHRDLAAPTLVRPRQLRAGFEARVHDTGGSGLLHAGEQWAPPRFMINKHLHETWEFYLQLHGITRWHADHRSWTVRPGDLFGVAPQIVHAMTEEPGANIHFVYAAIDPARPLGRHLGLAAGWTGLGRVIHLHKASDLVDPFAQLINEVATGRQFLGTGLTLAVDRIVLELTRRLRQVSPSRVLDSHPAVQEIRTLLDRDYARPWRLKDLADRVGLAPNYLAGLFTAEHGRGPHEYQTERKIARAKQLLTASDLSITAIAVEVGFSSGQHLARTFRQQTGTTPSAYRNG